MAKIRHLAMFTTDPEKLVKFYEDVFDMKVVLRRDTGAIYMTDGYINLAVLKNKGNQNSGLNHFGFQVEDMDATIEKLEAAGGLVAPLAAHNPPYAEKRTIDPDGNTFDLSVHGYLTEEFQEERGEKQPARAKETADA